MRDKPDYCYESGCPLAEKGIGFVLGSGDPKTSKYAYILEAPGKQEVSYLLRPTPGQGYWETQEEIDRELAIRRRDYPDLPERFLKYGAPVVGPSGAGLHYWINGKVGITRGQVYFDNTLRCLPPKAKGGAQYPTGDERKGAEQCCRHYDRISDYRPDTLVCTLHPASLLRSITPLPLVVKDIEKVRDFTAAGRRVICLLGGKAIKAFTRITENSAKWRGHYVSLSGDWIEQYKEAFVWKKKERKKAVRLTKVERAEVDYFAESASGIKRRKRRKKDVHEAKTDGSVG